MDGGPQARAWWPAVGAPLERGVRPHSFVADYMVPSRVKTGPAVVDEPAGHAKAMSLVTS